ncbi:MAG TPA: thioredoxin domain-containing protein [Terriglobales bacterium]|nr:thioredoxin domain-containing protein [Terriglobales bacterium]
MATNSLAQAASAYLRSAMHQPIHWHEWGEEAFAASERENKPILLDIGAVWCHWCHVMDHESYDDPEVARIVNENFIAVKVDRDERPDIDSRYQAAVSAISGQGGWPLTAFLTPDGKPFYGGTYFPPDERMGRPSFKRVLLSIAGAFREKHSDVREQADMVMKALSQAESFTGRSAELSPKIVESIVRSATRLFDVEHGGFGTAPKFPHASILDLIIDRYARSGEPHLKTVIETTLMHMARGGVYDQLAGGFHRYSVDERWVVPHFEKMSYDNSELLKNYVHAWQALRDPFFAEVARDIIRWMDEVLSDRERGGFYASQDADINMEDDGDYFTWTLEEARAVLGGDELKAAGCHYDIGEIGEMHHNPQKNVLHVRSSVEEVAARMGVPAERVRALLDAAKQKMLAARLKRPTPYVDKTVYVNWNALCVSAYLDAARVLELDDARHFALRSLDRILTEAWKPETGLMHVVAYSDPAAQHRAVPGLLDDYAFTVIACLDAYETTAALSYFNFARRIGDAMIERFLDESGGGFFDVEKSKFPPLAKEAKGGRPAVSEIGALSAQRKPFQDSPTPAGNSAAVIALLRLYAYTHVESYRDKARQTLEVFAGMAEQYGIFAGTYGIAASLFSTPHTQVVVVGGEQADKLYAAAVAGFALGKSVVRIPGENEAAPQNLPPVLAETIPNLLEVKAGKPVAVVCSNFTCQPPVSDAEALAAALRDAA